MLKWVVPCDFFVTRVDHVMWVNVARAVYQTVFELLNTFAAVTRVK